MKLSSEYIGIQERERGGLCPWQCLHCYFFFIAVLFFSHFSKIHLELSLFPESMDPETVENLTIYTTALHNLPTQAQGTLYTEMVK